MKEQLGHHHPHDISAKPQDFTGATSSAAGGGVIKRKARESLDEEFNEEDEDMVTSSSSAIKPQPGKRSRKEGNHHGTATS